MNTEKSELEAKGNVVLADVSGMFAFADWCIKETIFTWEEKFPNKYFLINPKAYNTARQYTIEELYEKFQTAKANLR